MPMLRGVVKSLYEYYGINPQTYVVGAGDQPEPPEFPAEPGQESSSPFPPTTPAEVYKHPEELSVPKTPGCYSEDEEPPSKQRNIVPTTPLALRKGKRTQKKRIVYSPS